MSVKRAIIPTVALVACLSSMAQDAAPAQTGRKSPAQELYEQAVSERAAGNPKQAVQTAARVVALYSHDKAWLPKAELLCAELYVDMDMPDAAGMTARQVRQLYEGTDVAKQAAALETDIEKMKAVKESKESDQ